MSENCGDFDQPSKDQCDKAEYIIWQAEYVIRSIFTISVTILIIKRGQLTSMPWLAKFVLAGMITQWLIYSIYDIFYKKKLDGIYNV